MNASRWWYPKVVFSTNWQKHLCFFAFQVPDQCSHHHLQPGKLHGLGVQGNSWKFGTLVATLVQSWSSWIVCVFGKPDGPLVYKYEAPPVNRELMPNDLNSSPGFCGGRAGVWWIKAKKLFLVHYFTEVTYSRSTGENEQVSRSQQRGENQPFMI